MNKTLTVIDSVYYDASWYNDAKKRNGGWSLELINPNESSPCPVSDNWTASNNSSGGTPGIQNSVYSISSDTLSPKLLSFNIIDSTHIYICFSKSIDSLLLKNDIRI